MSGGTLTKVIAACCGLSAFTIAVLAGLSADNPGDVILIRALVSMVACQAVGLLIGMVIERVIVDSVEAYKRDGTKADLKPLSELSTTASPGTGAAAS